MLKNPKYWDAECFTTEHLTKDPARRVALCLKLRGVTIRNNADEDHLFVILTRFHRATAHSGYQFQDHDRVTAVDSTLKLVSRESASKWMIAGALATQDLQLAMSITAAVRD